jgi:hypothetical protein
MAEEIKKYNSTITDKDKYIVEIVDTNKYDALTENEKTVFLILRNSILEIFPMNEKTGNPDYEVRRYAENYAFINLKAITVNINLIVDQKLIDFKTNMEKFISTTVTNTKNEINTNIDQRLSGLNIGTNKTV